MARLNYEQLSIPLTKRAISDTDSILYSFSQYRALLHATVATSAISIICSLLIIIVYLYFRMNSTSKTNRLSLRCVFSASLMNLINAIFDISIVLMYGDTTICRASTVITMFTRIMSASFLALVGLNLVLVFVLDVPTSSKAIEWYYYVGAIVYGLATISVPIYEESQGVLSPDLSYSCYYYVHFHQMLGQNTLLWMWFYAFLFLAVLTAVACSVVALIKLMQEHHNLVGNFANIPDNSNIERTDTADGFIKKCLKSQSNIFRRVVTRCVIYPLVPFISNIWGFIFQVMILSSHSSLPSKYSISMIDAISKGLQGFFVAMVFFSDPAMTEFIKNQCLACKQKYLDDFSQVKKYSDGQIEAIPPKTSTLVAPHTITSFITPPLPAILASENTLKDDVTLDWDPRQNSKRFPGTEALGIRASIVPMRRLSVSPSVYSRIYNLQQHMPIQENHYITPPITPTGQSFVEGSRRSSQSVTIDTNIDHRVLVPYKYPRLAAVVHWTLLKCGFKPSSSLPSEVITTAHQKESITSTRSSSSISAIVNIPPETSTTHLT